MGNCDVWFWVLATYAGYLTWWHLHCKYYRRDF